MKKIVTAIFLLSLVQSGIYAQSNDNALGLRFGGTSGLTYKHHNGNGKAMEGILGFWGNGFSLTGLIEKQVSAFNQPGLSWYYGYGAHLAIFNTNSAGNGYGRGERNYEDSELGIGVDGLLELQYRIQQTPVSLSFGLKPFIEFDTDGGVHAGPDPAFSVRFHF